MMFQNTDIQSLKREASVIKETMRRVGSPNRSLAKTSADRASISDLNKLREKDFVSSYLDRLTNTVKLEKSDVQKAESMLDPSTYLSAQ